MKDRQMRFLVLGLDNAGKSTVVARWLNHDIDSIAPTFGFEIHDIVVEEGSSLVTVWDIGGQECIRAFWRSYFEGGTDAICFVVDAADTARMNKAKAELAKVLLSEGEEKIGVFNGGGASVLVLVNKQDLPNSSSLDHVKEVMKLEEFSSSEHDINIMGCSAKQNAESCTLALQWLVKSVNKRRYQ